MSPKSITTGLSLGSSTIVVGLNAALQKRFILSGDESKLVPGDVHRASSVEFGIGGKGQDVAIALSCLASKDSKKEESDKLLLAQFVGSGAEGDTVMDLLERRLGNTLLYGEEEGEDSESDAKVRGLTVRPMSQMRTCTTIVASDCATELVEPSGLVEEDELSQLMDRVEQLATLGDGDSGSREAADAICIMGSMPPGCPVETYADLVERAADKDSLCLIDSVVGLEPLLRVLAAKKENSDDQSGANVLKVNLAELCKMANVSEKGDKRELVVSSVQGFLSEFGPDAGVALSHIAITDGKDPAHLVEILGPQTNGSTSPSFRVWKIGVPDLGSTGGQLLYPIGAGDTVAAGTLAAWKYLHQHGEEKIGRVVGSLVGERSGKVLSSRKSEFGGFGGNLGLAFSFGLACASASCLQQENSVFEVDTALELLSEMPQPTSIHE